MIRKYSLIIVTLLNSYLLSAQVMVPDGYMNTIIDELTKEWPSNKTLNLVFHGHSVPAGYFATPTVNSSNAYPMQTVCAIKNLYPYAVVNSIVTAIGGENSQNGSQRFISDVLCMKPDVVFIDYALNDRYIGMYAVRKYWCKMIEDALRYGCKVVLLTPTPDLTENILDRKTQLAQHADQIRELAIVYNIALVDCYKAFEDIASVGEDLGAYMSQSNHPNERGHTVVRDLICKLFQNNLDR